MQRVAHTDNADEPHPSVSQHSANSSTKRSIQQDSNYPASSPARPPGLPTFAQWQAKQLSSRDIIFAVFVLSMYLLYLRKTVPAVCSNAPMNSQQQGMGGHYRQQQWPTLWHVICGQPLGGALSGNWFTTAFMSLVKVGSFKACAHLVRRQAACCMYGSTQYSVLGQYLRSNKTPGVVASDADGNKARHGTHVCLPFSQVSSTAHCLAALLLDTVVGNNPTRLLFNR